MEENNRQNHREDRKRSGRSPAREERTAPRKTAAALEERSEGQQPSARRREGDQNRPAANFLSIQVRRLMRRVR